MNSERPAGGDAQNRTAEPLALRNKHAQELKANDVRIRCGQLDLIPAMCEELTTLSRACNLAPRVFLLWQ